MVAIANLGTRKLLRIAHRWKAQKQFILKKRRLYLCSKSTAE
jgi:hypothetical protein